MGLFSKNAKKKRCQAVMLDIVFLSYILLSIVAYDYFDPEKPSAGIERTF